MNSNPAFGLEWLRRMRRLGYQSPGSGEMDYCGLGTAGVIDIAKEMDLGRRRVFLVWPCSSKALGFPVRYRNARYAICEVMAE